MSTADGRPDLGVELHELMALAQWMDQSAKEFEEDVRRHMEHVRSVVGATWMGTAAMSHEQEWADWLAAISGLIGALSSDAALLRSAAGSYQHTDHAVADELSFNRLGEI